MSMSLFYDAEPVAVHRANRSFPRWAGVFAALLLVASPSLAQTLIAYPTYAVGQTIIFHDEGLGEYEIIGTHSYGVYRSDPTALGKKRWYESNECAVPGCALQLPLYVNDMEELANGDILMGVSGYHGLWRSTNGAATWIQVLPSAFDELPPNSVLAITQSEANPDFVYLSADDGYTYFSQDGGQTFIYNGQLPGGSSQVPWSLQTHPNQPNWVYAGTFGYGVWKSEDNGGLWFPMYDNEMLKAQTAGHMFDIKFDPNDDDKLYAATGQGVWRYEDVTDSGLSWEPVETVDKSFDLIDGTEVKYTRPEVRSIDFDANGDMYVATWGFGIIKIAAPGDPLPLGSNPEQIQLRNGLVSVVAIGGNGTELFAATDAGVIQINLGSATSAEGESDVPSGYALSQNFPNPFNPTTSISFEMPVGGQVELAVYDLFGRRVATLVDGVRSAGTHSVTFDASNLASGVYMYRLEADGFTMSRSLALVK